MSDELNNCSPGGYDVYQRMQSCARDDSATTPEDVPVSIPVLDNDVDGSGEGLTVSGWTPPKHGTVSKSGDEVVYTPDPNYVGSDSFTYETIDGSGFIDEATVDVIVTPANDGPIAMDDRATTPEDTRVTIPVLDNDSDPDGDRLTVSKVTQPNDGVSGIRSDGTVLYLPDPGFTGEDTFTYEVCDRSGACDEAEVVVTVVPRGNDQPAAINDAITISEGMDPGPEIPVLANSVIKPYMTMTIL